MISVHKCHSSDLIFKNNHGNSSSGELYYSPQSGQPNYDDTIFRASHRNCSVKKCSEKFCKIHKKTPVSESPYWKKDSDTGAFLFFCEFGEIFKNNLFTEHLRKTASVFYWRKKNMLFTLGWEEQIRHDTAMFLLEIFVQNLVLGFFGPKKIRCKTCKKHIETFYHWYRFYFVFDLDKTNILGSNYSVNFLQSNVNFSNFK